MIHSAQKRSTRKMFSNAGILAAWIFIAAIFPSPGFLHATENEPLRYRDPVFEAVDIQSDIEFGEVVNFEGETETLTLDIYTPRGDTEQKRPAILWIHGGGFRNNDKTQGYIVQMSNRFARRGYVCISINYRLRDNPNEDYTGTVKDAVSDAMRGLDWLRSNSKDLGVDRDRIVIGGGSAGGMIAVNLCYKDGTSAEPWNKEGIIAMVNLWGSPPADRRQYTITPDDPPTIIVHGTEDESVLYANSAEIVKELNGQGVKHELITIEGAGHTPARHMDDFAVRIAHFLYDLL